MRAYEIRIAPVDDDRTWRLVEIGDRQTLHRLNQLIRDEFALRGNHLYCFYVGGDPYLSKLAYGGPRADTRREATRSNLGNLGLKKGKRLTYVYNFTEDRVFQLNVQRVHGVADGTKLPRVTKRQGKVPEPRPPEDDGKRKDVHRAFKDVTARLRSTAEAWSQGKRPSRSALKQELALALELGKRVSGEWETIKLIELHTSSDISGWLIALPEALAAEGLIDEALGVIEVFSELEPQSFLGDKPLILCKAGREQEAKESAEANTERFADDAWIWAKAGDVAWQSRDTAVAETSLRRALELAGKTQYLRESILERLLALLEETGKSDAAQELAEAEKKRRSRSDRH